MCRTAPHREGVLDPVAMLKSALMEPHFSRQIDYSLYFTTY